MQKFLAHAVQLEREAARRYEELAAAMQTAGNVELNGFFARMAYYSRAHLADAMKRGAFRDVPTLHPHEYEWPEGISPEVAEWAGVDPLMEGSEALRLALESERRGHAYYAAMACTSTDPEVRLLASEFAAEEWEHAQEIERLLATSRSG